MAGHAALNIRRDEGQIIVLFAAFTVVLIGILALTIDVGYLYSQRREAQSAVDAAALAGGTALLAGESDGVIRNTSEVYLAFNGIDMDAEGLISAITPAGDRNDGTVTVELTHPVERFFLGAIYTGAWEISARAVVEINDERNGEYALVALDPAGMYFNGDMEVTIINGSTMSNGNVENSGEASIFISGGTIDAVGTIDANNSWYAPEGIYPNRPPMPDPLSGLQPPDPNTLPVIEQDAVPDCSEACTLLPGYYRELNLDTIRTTATLEPGVYYFENTVVELQNTGSLITGDDVLLYFTGPAGRELFIPKNGGVHLTTPAAGPAYEGGLNGMVVWIDNCGAFNSSGNEEFYIEGVFYAPCSEVWMHGNPDGETIRGQVIVGTLDIRGTSEMIVHYVNYVNTPRFELWLVD